MKLEKAKLNPNAVNDKGTKPMKKINLASNRKHSKQGKITNPMEIPNVQGYVGKRIKTS